MTDPIARVSEDVPDRGALPRRRPPFYRDPLSLLGWSVALAAIVAYWFFFARKPVARPGEPIARVTAVAGTVRVQSSTGAPWVDVKLADILRVGDVVQTQARSGAEIWFESGSRVNVRPLSVVYIRGSAESSTAAWRVQAGRVDFSSGQATEIETPTARTTALQNATGNIDVAESGATGVKVFSGQAEVRTKQGQTITLGENQAVRVDEAGQAGARLDLPPPPSLVAPALRASLERVPPPAPSAELQWSAVVGGVTYHVAVDYNVTQANLLLSAALEETGLPGTSHPLTGLEPGRYFWRVAAVNRDGLEGAFSKISFFSVVPAATPKPSPASPPPAPLLVVQSAEQVAPGIVQVTGRTQSGAAVEIGGSRVLVLPDGSFSEYVRSAGGTVVVKATSRSGAVAEESRPVTRP